MNYPAAIERLLTNEAYDHYAITTAGTENALADLQGLNVDELFHKSGQSRNSSQMAQACISGLWLLHNFLDQSHDISQSLKTPVGSHWHAIMHRLEGDFSNSKYWYRGVGNCELYDQISERSGQSFDPMAFVDRVENEGSAATHDIAVAEWQVLFEHCFLGATGD